MGDIDFKASASAEANVVKIGDPTLNVAPTVNLNLGRSGERPDREPFVQRFLSGTKKALNPAGYAREQAEVLNIQAVAEAKALASHESAIAEACKICLDGNPWMTNKQAYLHVMGHPVTPAEAENVFEVFEKARRMLPNETVVDEPLEEFKDASVRGAASAYDDEVRNLWAKLIAGELERSGSFPKSTYDVLQRMDSRVINLFKTLCSTCVGSADGVISISTDPLPFLVYDEGSTSVLNGGLLSILDLYELETAGLFFTALHRTFDFETTDFIGINSIPYQIIPDQQDGERKTLRFENGLLSDAGTRLSSLCETGNFPLLPELMAKKVKGSGMRFVRLEPTGEPSTFTCHEF